MSIHCVCRPVLRVEGQPLPLYEAAGFSGALGDLLLVDEGGIPVLLSGLGAPESLTPAVIREAAALAGKRLGGVESASWDFAALADVPVDRPTAVRALAEGSLLGAYHPKSGGTATEWVGPDEEDLAGPWRLGRKVAEAVQMVRNLVNAPANILTPSSFAQRCAEEAQRSGLAAVISEEGELEELGLGGILAMGRGSQEAPRVVELIHEGKGGPIALALVGKGVTFDSGGLSLKPADGMIGMKHDLAGAATVLGAMSLLEHLAPDLHVRAYLPIVENLPGPGAARPGDIAVMRNGCSVEILNTDFEGRVILADALTLASEHSPAAIIDVATLTLAAINALGDRTAALFGNNHELIERVTSAARNAAEPVWELPMPSYLREQLLSDIADYKNYPGVTTARAITAAMFLSEFVPASIPWAHLDIAGPAWAAAGYGLTQSGGTGFGVRLLAELFTSLSEAGGATDVRGR